MILVRLTYFSRNHLDRFNGPIEDRVAEILAISVENNRRDEISGALIYDAKWFGQILEGRESVISRTFERILRDQRHADIALVAMQPITERRFANHPMAGVAQDEDNVDLFRHYAESQRFDPSLMRPERLADLIEALVARSLRGEAPWTTRSATTAA
jgi:FAD-dependent sensor of blue light